MQRFMRRSLRLSQGKTPSMMILSLQVWNMSCDRALAYPIKTPFQMVLIFRKMYILR